MGQEQPPSGQDILFTPGNKRYSPAQNEALDYIVGELRRGGLNHNALLTSLYDVSIGRVSTSIRRLVKRGEIEPLTRGRGQNITAEAKPREIDNEELFPKGSKRLGSRRIILDSIVIDLRMGGLRNKQVVESLVGLVPEKTIRTSLRRVVEERKVPLLPFIHSKSKTKTEREPKKRAVGQNELVLQAALASYIIKHPNEGVNLSQMVRDLGLVNKKGQPLTRERVRQLYVKIALGQPVPPLKTEVNRKQKSIALEITKRRKAAREVLVTAREALVNKVKQLHNQGLGLKAISEITEKPLGTISGIVGRLLKKGEILKLRKKPASRQERRTPEKIRSLDANVADLRRSQRLTYKEIATRLNVNRQDVANSITRLSRNDPSMLLIVKRTTEEKADFDLRVQQLAKTGLSSRKMANMLSVPYGDVASSVDRLISSSLQRLHDLDQEIQAMQSKGSSSSNLDKLIKQYGETFDLLTALQTRKFLKNRRDILKKY